MQSLVKIFVHVIFATKGREPMILPEFEVGVYQRLQRNLEKQEVEVIAINGMPEHVHIVLRLPSTKSTSEVIRWCKGETSHWFNNKRKQDQERQLYWQDGYAAFSVSENELHQVKEYVENQKEIHHQQTFAQEIEMLKGNLK